MSMVALPRAVAGLVVAVVIAGCGVIDPIVQPGWRHIVVSVENQSSRPAVIVVAEDGTVMGKLVGTVEPGVVPPGATIDVTFGLPPEPNWAIFVNQSPRTGPLLTPNDVPIGASGRAPIVIEVDAAGGAGVSTGLDTHGWMGQP